MQDHQFEPPLLPNSINSLYVETSNQYLVYGFLIYLPSNSDGPLNWGLSQSHVGALQIRKKSYHFPNTEKYHNVNSCFNNSYFRSIL